MNGFVSWKSASTSEIHHYPLLIDKMYVDNEEYQTKNLTNEKTEDSYQSDILFLLGTTMVIETILMIFLFSVIFLTITSAVFWFISVTWKLCKTKIFIASSEEDDDDQRLELDQPDQADQGDQPPSYTTLELQEADYPPPQYESVQSLMLVKPTSEERESRIKKRLLFERQSRLFRSLDWWSISIYYIVAKFNRIIFMI